MQAEPHAGRLLCIFLSAEKDTICHSAAGITHASSESVPEHNNDVVMRGGFSITDSHNLVQALLEHVEAVKAKLPERMQKAKESKKSEKALIEARVYLDGALFKMDHHPMEVGTQHASSSANCFLENRVP